MNQISQNDVVFATIIQRGLVLVSLKLQGLASMDELLRKMMSTLSAVTGIITLDVRNFTRGWNQRRSLILR
jgi:hypothetical protein